MSISNLLNRFSPFVLQLFKMGGSKPGDFFELVAQMRNAAVVHFPGNFRDIQFTVSNQFLNSLDFMCDDELPDGAALHFRKQVGEVGVVVLEFFFEVI